MGGGSEAHGAPTNTPLRQSTGSVTVASAPARRARPPRAPRALVLFGGGVPLANALADTDATRWLADAAVGAFADAPVPVVLLAAVTATVGGGEVASNTAMAAVLAPILVTVGPRYAASLGVAEVTAATVLALTGALAAGYGFALPVAPPPNATAIGAGAVSRRQMRRAGVVPDVAVILVARGR